MNKIKIDILPNYFLKEDGTFNIKDALNLSGKIAGVCYDREGFSHLQNEDEEKTLKRIKMTLNNGHHSVYDHINISFNLQNVPKILAMVLNNEHQYTTSEKSARYTPVEVSKDSIITSLEENLYNKWFVIFETLIKEKYGYIYNDGKIRKLAQENARYFVTVFMPTQMVYTTSLRQINYLASWMNDYIKNHDVNSYFENTLSIAMNDFINELSNKNILVESLMKNEKSRKLSLFGNNLENKKDYFGDVYTTSYKGTFASLAQAQRHRTLDYQMQFLDNFEFYIPEIIKEDKILTEEYLSDILRVKDIIPQGELILINESGKYDDFILKCKERLCSHAQLEIMLQTKEILSKYQKDLENDNNPLKNDIVKYTCGARCTFPDFVCTDDCKFKEGKSLRRKI